LEWGKCGKQKGVGRILTNIFCKGGPTREREGEFDIQVSGLAVKKRVQINMEILGKTCSDKGYASTFSQRKAKRPRLEAVTLGG